MSAIVVVGAQWGDEGKGKILDFIAKHFRIFVRFGGGANAGHTLESSSGKIVTHLLPSAVLYEARTLVLGPGMVVDAEQLLNEIQEIRGKGGLSNATIFVDQNVHLVLPTHKQVDKAKNQHIGTTGRGIGPAYEDRVGRRGVRFIDIENGSMPELEVLMDGLKRHVQFIDTSSFLHEKLVQDFTVVFEGAQGVMLDVDHGTYPYVTSSSTLPQNAALSCGLPMRYFGRSLGVTKAYATRVGEGPFPTELTDKIGDRLRKVGNEFGATTGRPRRCGWLDVAALRYAVRIAGLTHLAITKLDVLGGMQHIKVCVGYELNGQTFNEIPVRLGKKLEQARPVYEKLAGWSGDISNIRWFSDLPENARSFVSRIEELTGCSALLVSTGPRAEQTIVTNGKFFTE